MNTDQERITSKHAELTQRVIGVFYDVYNELGYGFVESIYEAAMRMALVQAGMKVATQVPISVQFRGELIGTFKADMIVDDVVLVELKTCDGLLRQHESQTLHYLRATRIEVALLMNFGPSARFKRLIMDNEMKHRRSV